MLKGDFLSKSSADAYPTRGEKAKRTKDSDLVIDPIIIFRMMNLVNGDLGLAPGSGFLISRLFTPKTAVTGR
jgi:hypothetical protein